MTTEEHRERHKLLHQQFDELIADYFSHHGRCRVSDGNGPIPLPSNTTLMQLMEWSYQQTIEPTELPIERDPEEPHAAPNPG